MSPVKPVPEIHPADRATMGSPIGRLPLGSSCPKSPKFQELRARYEALHATEDELKPSKSDQS